MAVCQGYSMEHAFLSVQPPPKTRGWHAIEARPDGVSQSRASFMEWVGTSLHKLHIHHLQQGFHLGLRFIGVALSVADEREGFEMREGF